MRSTRGRAKDEMISRVDATRRPLWILLAASRPGIKNKKKVRKKENQEGPIQVRFLTKNHRAACVVVVVFGVELLSALFVIYAIIMHWVNSHSRPLFHPLLDFLYSPFLFLWFFGLECKAKHSIWLLVLPDGVYRFADCIRWASKWLFKELLRKTSPQNITIYGT